MMQWLKKNRTAVIAVLLTALFFAANSLLLLRDFYYLPLLPLAGMVLLLFVLRMEHALLAMALFTPFAVDFAFFPGMELSMPVEPMMILFTLMFLFRVLASGQYDSRLLRHPAFNRHITEKLMYADITAIDQTIEKFGAASEIGKYYLAKMLKHYNMDNNAPFDEILVHLYDKYYLPNHLQLYSDTYERTLKRAVMRKRHTLIGAEIPHLEAINADGKRETTENPQRSYTVIWFWDPDCEDCQEETPILHKMYAEHAEEYDFEVFALSLTADIERWKRISKEWGLTWPNTCSEMGETNYDFIDYFSIVTTPCCLLIDKDHKIIMRQFSLEQLEEFFQNNKKTE